MSEVQETSSDAPMQSPNGGEAGVTSEAPSAAVGADQQAAPIGGSADGQDAVMTDAPLERSSESRERPISTTPIPLPQIPHMLGAKSTTPTPTVGTQGPATTTSTASASAAPGAPSSGANASPSPMPGRTTTPRGGNSAVNGEAAAPAAAAGGTGSRAASQHPNEAAAPPLVLPAEAAAHGAPVRQYLNSKVTKSLLEGMKLIGKEQPKDPLRVLGEFLLQRSKELEGSN